MHAAGSSSALARGAEGVLTTWEESFSLQKAVALCWLELCAGWRRHADDAVERATCTMKSYSAGCA